MADITIKRSHPLGLNGARSAANAMIDKLEKQFSLTCHWQGDTLHFDRPGVNGRLAVSAGEMNLEVKLGFLLKAMKAPIEHAVHEQLDKVIAAAASSTAAASKAPADPPTNTVIANTDVRKK